VFPYGKFALDDLGPDILTAQDGQGDVDIWVETKFISQCDAFR